MSRAGAHVAVVIQARMSSSRLPGKVLADLNIFEGWKNDDLLRQYEVPSILSAAQSSAAYRIVERKKDELTTLPGE